MRNTSACAMGRLEIAPAPAELVLYMLPCQPPTQVPQKSNITLYGRFFRILSEGLFGDLYPPSPEPHSPKASLSAFAWRKRTTGSCCSGGICRSNFLGA